LPEDRYEPCVEGRRAELRETYLSLLLELATACEERGELGPATEALRRAVAEEPTQEETHVSLMRLYALSGRWREALRQYEQLREALFREFRDRAPSGVQAPTAGDLGGYLPVG
jgi:DNA-binding SARP family transcriptional activator